MQDNYIPRDISWLDFNGRVLNEASNPNVPLYERIKFLAIFSSNLDEFFRVRVSALRQFKKLRKKTKEQMKVKPKKILREVLDTIHNQQEQFGQIFNEEIVPALMADGIFLKDESQLSKKEIESAKTFFDHKIKAQIHLQELSDNFPIPFLSNKGIYFIVLTENRENPLLFALPETDRFVVLESEKDFTVSFVDDIIRANIDQLIPEDKILEVVSIKLSRDAEMYIDDEFTGDLLDKIKKGINDRNFGLPTRFLYDQEISDQLLERIKLLFKLSNQDMIPGGRYHNFHDLFGFPKPANASEKLNYKELPGLQHLDFDTDTPKSEIIKQKDIFLHFPYNAFDCIPSLIEEAAADKNVSSIRITLYRIGSNSRLTEALKLAALNEKEVFVFIEAKARFDEASNMYWGTQLTESGAKVVYSFPQIKVHAKIMQISYTDNSYVSYVGTGNFNETNARIYTDFTLLTGSQAIGDDIRQVFQILQGTLIIPKHKKIRIAPFALRDFIEEAIDQEIQEACSGQKAEIIAKLNNLEDQGIIEKLTEAANKGVKIKLLIRGICCMHPDTHPNIEIKRLVDRFLEHARFYYFHAADKRAMYISSADWMTRNLDRRIEVACPIENETYKDQLLHIFNTQWNDHIKAGPHFEEFKDYQYNTGDTAQEIIYKEIKEQYTKKRLPLN
ncbi:MAG: polyphosphate kinase 1 [Saprospiraceae bacterium]|nr:polyphosphate kinase 1 [Saprospiraceae bacterium]